MQTNFGKQYFKQETSKVYPNSAGKLVENRRDNEKFVGLEWPNFAPQLGSIQAQFLCTCLITQQLYTSHKS